MFVLHMLLGTHTFDYTALSLVTKKMWDIFLVRQQQHGNDESR